MKTRLQLVIITWKVQTKEITFHNELRCQENKKLNMIKLPKEIWKQIFFYRLNCLQMKLNYLIKQGKT